MQEEMMEELRQWVLEDLLNRIYDSANFEKCLAINQAEPGKKEQLNMVSENLKGMIAKSCKLRAVNYYASERIGG